MIRIGINGYGRIGRCILHAIYETGRNQQFDIVAINDLSDKALLAHLTQFDSTHGHFPADVKLQDDLLTINGDNIRLLSQPNPAELPWAGLDVDLVIECSGQMKSRDKVAAHLTAGAPRVLLSHPLADADQTVVYGVNHQYLDNRHQIVSNASCTTNCLAPVAKILHDAIGIECGAMTTIHSYTNDQHLLDRAPGDFYRARAAALSMIPTKTGAAEAVGLVLPELAGKLHGMAVRVPTPNVSLVDFHFTAGRDTNVDEINQLMRDAASGAWAGIVACNELPLVSVDFNHHSASSIFDSAHTAVTQRQVKIMSWYDNEWGFSNRMLDVALCMVQ